MVECIYQQIQRDTDGLAQGLGLGEADAERHKQELQAHMMEHLAESCISHRILKLWDSNQLCQADVSRNLCIVKSNLNP